MHIHILGICGTFMGGLAALAREAGHRVTGCDAGVYPPMSDQLRGLGIDLIEGFGADQMALAPEVFVVGNVVSRARMAPTRAEGVRTALGRPGDGAAQGSPKFPLMEAILDAGAPYTSGPQWLADHLLRGRHVLAVAGTHGKTTTTSMLAWILESAGLAPGFLVGGVPLNFGISARLGAADAPFVIEADEYDTAFFDKRSKFVHYRPRTAVLNNLEFDHADIFDDLAAIERQFHHLVRTVPGRGRIVFNSEEESLRRVLAQGCWSEAVGFGTGGRFGADGSAEAFTVLDHGAAVAQVRWDLSGAHNRMNALAAIAAAEHLGVPPATAAEALQRFQNVKRRMELRGSVATPGGAVRVFDDFAHHPTAIRTTVDGLRRQTGAGQRILAVFEPRSNTMKLGTMNARLPWSLEGADLAFCHAANLGWDPAQALASMGERVQVASDIDTLVRQIVDAARGGDQILCMSNGGFGGIHGRLLESLAQKFSS